MARILHMADIHLDSPMKNIKNPAISAMRRQEIRDSFCRAVDFATQNKVDIAIIAGDLFDNEYTVRQTVRLVCDTLAAAKDVHFIITPGNHDCVTRLGYAGIEWPQNVHVFMSDSIEQVCFSDIDTTVWGTGFTSPYRTDNALTDFKVTGDGINIIAIHGDLVEGSSSYLPIRQSDIAESGADYVALGHIHAYSGIKKAGKTVFAYPGCLEGRGFDETSDKGFIFGEIEKGSCELKFFPFAKRRYIIEEMDVSNAQSLMEIYGMISENASKYGKDTFLRILLTGELSPLISIPYDASDAIEGPYFLEIIDQTHPVKDVKAIANQNNLTGLFAAKILEELNSANKQEAKILENALKLGLLALDGEKVYWDEDK